MQKRNHSRELKLEVVRQITTGQKRPAQVCREYGLAESVLSRWRKEYQQRGEAAFQAVSSEKTLCDCDYQFTASLSGLS